MTSELRRIIRSANVGAKTAKTLTVETISHKTLCRALRSISVKECSIRQILRPELIFLSHEDAVKQHIPPRRNAALEQRMKLLRARLENSQYASMVKDIVSQTEANNASVEDVRLRRLAPQMSLAFNVIVTMATCFTAAYYIFKNATGNRNIGLIAGVIGLIVAMIVEVVLLLTKLYSIDDNLRKHNKATRLLVQTTSS